MMWRPLLRAAAEAAATPAAAKASPKTSFFDLALTVPNLGVGAKLGRSIWLRYPNSYIEVTRVKPTKSLQSGKAWGLHVFKGVPEAGPREIRGLIKKDWAFYNGPAVVPPAKK